MHALKFNGDFNGDYTDDDRGAVVSENIYIVAAVYS